jgi:hypothetical protein
MVRVEATESTAKCVGFWLILSWFFLDHLGIIGLVVESANPTHCQSEKPVRLSRGGAHALDELPIGSSSVGYGTVGQHGSMGFEGLCITVDGA